jgi:hypothetical protein
MAIAFVAAGTPVGVDTGASGTTVAVPTPAGLAANQLLILAIGTDDKIGPASLPAGWRKLTSAGAGTPTSSPYYAPPRGSVYWKIATGSEGASVNVLFAGTAWPLGSPFVVAAMLAYSGTDLSNPVETFSTAVTALTTPALAHPVVTTTVANDWLLTFRWGSSNFDPISYTVTGGTNAERIDTTDNQPELSMALYDSNGALATGAQTQRTTTASIPLDYGSVGLSIAIRPPTTNMTTATPSEANAIGTAFNAVATGKNGPWDTCATMPGYSFSIDWNGDGSLTTPGAVLDPNPYMRTDISGWTSGSAVISWSTDLVVNDQGMPVMKIVPDGVSVSGGAGQSPRTPVDSIVPGNTYVCDAWVYSPGGWADLRSCIDWYDNTNSFLSTGLGSATVVSAGVWTHLVQTLVAPDTASRAAVRVRHGGTPPSSALYYAWGILLIDPSVPGNFVAPGPNEDVTADVLSGGVTVSYGRDQFRQLSPAKNGTAGFSLNNVNRTYSPENTTSPLYGDLDPARSMRGQVTFIGKTYSLGSMRIDDYNVHADIDNRTVDFTFQDGMKSLDGPNLSTPVLSSRRTGDLVNYILDQVGWTAGRAIDPGATVVPWWWVEGTNALSAIQDLVKSEGPPAIAYVALDGTFVFRDRHHRILNEASLVSQANFSQNEIDPCESPAVTGLSFTAPFEYAHGWRDIVNSVQFTSSTRQPASEISQVWQYGTSFSLSIGQSITLAASGSDPFVNAVTPVQGTDFTTAGIGTVQVTLSRDNGQAVNITFLAIGGSVTVNDLQLRARPIPVVGTQNVSRTDTTSIASHGEQTYPDTAPWASSGDAYAIAGTILLYYAKRRPTVQLRIVARDPEHLRQILERRISDRIHIVYGEMRIDDDFFIESVTHQIDRMNKVNQPPVHSVVYGCEMGLGDVNANPFRFDVRGSGFDQGVFDPLVGDNPASVFVFDDVRGSFDVGVFGT